MRLASEIFIENLKAIRKQKGLTQVMLAELAEDEKLSRPQEIIDVETGEIISEPNDEIISKLRDILGDCFIVR